MKKMTKRSLAWLASLMMLISLLASCIVLPVQAATVDYVYSGNYVYNWGQREELATFLSPMAQEFYEDNNVDFATLTTLSGASAIGDVPYSDLYDALHELMYENLDKPTSYGDTRDMFKYTDCQNSGGAISSFYSGESIGPEWDGGATWNREHTWPNSKSNGKSDTNTQRETDIMMLRPASVSENSSRSNTAYGEGSSFYHPNKEGNGTYDLRGDVSRIVLYVYVCWGGSSQHDGALDYMWGSSGVIESKDVLLKWMEEDPVDTWELGRNDSVEAITGTRNVFVDYPELAFKLFNADVPADYDSPSGEGTSAGYTITASTNNANYGTVSVKGSTITASPKTGYAVSGYTILSGTATVTRNGNVLSVVPTSDVSIRVNFSKRTQSTVQFACADGTVTSQVAYTGDVITLPAHSGNLQSGHTFLGWVEGKVEDTTVMPTYVKAGENYTVNADVVLYALYSRLESVGSGSSNVFEKYSGTITEGDYLLVYNLGAMEAAKAGTASRLNVVDVTVSDDTITNPGASIIWNVAKSGDYWTLYNASTNSYAIANGSKNNAVMGAAGTDYSLWTVTGNNTYEFTNKGNQAKGVNYTLRRNGTYGFACYATTTGGALTLYKRQAGTLYYFSANADVAQHEYDNACDPDCNKCGEVRVPADHDYDHGCDTTCNECGAVRTPYPHEYDNACDTSCNVCGAIRQVGDHVYDNACDPYCNECSAERTITHVYVGNVTLAATCGKDGVMTYTCSVCGVYYTEVIPATGDHTYDNACDADCNACGTARTPADHVYTADCDITCNVCGAQRTLTGGETTITFDADASNRLEISSTTQVWQNDNLIVTNNKGSATSNVANYTNPVRFYQGSEIIIAYPGMTSLVIVAPTGTYGDPWATTLANAGLKYEEEGGVYTVTFTEPVDSITLTAAKQIRANAITAVGGATAEHNYQAVVTAPDCVNGGYTTYTCVCGDTYIGAETEALGHNYANACDADCNACGGIREVGDHVYDHANDTTCNECGAVRLIAAQILSGGQTSISEDVNGLAFFFTANVSGATVQNGYEYVTNSASVVPFVGGASYPVVRMGAVVSNGVSFVDIEAKYLWDVAEEECSFAVRLIDIPDNHKDTTITAKPYYVYVVDGEEIVVYGESVSKSYNEAAQ